MAKRKRTDNTMAKRKTTDNTMAKDTKGVIRSRESKDRQYNGQKIPKG
jgi:hypothetical protein